MKKSHLLGAAIAAFPLLFHPTAQASQFTPLGFLLGFSNSQATALSADGSVVVGRNVGQSGFITEGIPLDQWWWYD